MRRRDFITVFASATAWSLAARAQQTGMPTIGFLSDASPGPYAPYLAAFRTGLAGSGFVEGQNVAIELRWAEGHHDRLPALAADLVKHHVTVIVCSGGNVTAPAAVAATKTIPIVFSMGGDPVRAGLVASLNKPGGNVTGIAQLSSTLMAKDVELIRELVPGASVVGFLVSSDAADVEIQLQTVRDAAHSVGAQIVVGRVGGDGDFDGAFAELVNQHVNAVVVGGGAFFTSRSVKLAAFALHHDLPMIYARREFAQAGGLMSYGPSLADIYRQVGVYTGRVLKGEKPAELPIMQPTKFDLVINLKTAKALNLIVPPALVAIADEVIE